MRSETFSAILRHAAREDPLAGHEPEVIYGTGDGLIDALPSLSPDNRERLVEIAGEEAGVAIGREYSRFLAVTSQEALARGSAADRKAGGSAKKRLLRFKKLVQELQDLRLHPYDLHEWGLAVYAGEALELKAAVDRLAGLLDSSPMLGRNAGRPRKYAKNSLALRIARHLKAAGVGVGRLSDVLDLLLGADGGDHSRQLRYVRDNL